MKKFFLVYLFLVCVTSGAFAQSPCARNDLKEALLKLEEIASYFRSTQCAREDNVCWWFMFHHSIGEPGSQSMTQFAQKVPIIMYPELGYSSFAGEAHIAQYPAYWLLKRVKLNTILRSKETFEEYLANTPWNKVYLDTVHHMNSVNINEELSWYWMTRAKYPNLSKLEQTTTPESACGGGHHITGMYFANNPAFKGELNEFMGKINDLLLSEAVPPIYQNYPYLKLYKFYILSHAFEVLALTQNKNLIDNQLIDKAIEHINNIYEHFQQTKTQALGPESFLDLLKQDGTSHFYYGDTLGHFRYGLNLCSGLDQ